MDDMLNLYGDDVIDAGVGRGVDVAVQRADDLDKAALAHVRRFRGCPLHVLEVGCGAGGQMKRMIDAGARVTGIDRDRLQQSIARTFGGALPDGARFIRADVETLPLMQPSDIGLELGERFDMLMSQRTLHYLRHDDALVILHDLMARFLAPGAPAFLSFSGLGSELGDGYPAAGRPAAARFACLGAVMRAKHHILDPVALYTIEEAEALCRMAGFEITEAWTSPFGNIKITARIPVRQ